MQQQHCSNQTTLHGQSPEGSTTPANYQDVIESMAMTFAANNKVETVSNTNE